MPISVISTGTGMAGGMVCIQSAHQLQVIRIRARLLKASERDVTGLTIDFGPELAIMVQVVVKLNHNGMIEYIEFRVLPF